MRFARAFAWLLLAALAASAFAQAPKAQTRRTGLRALSLVGASQTLHGLGAQIAGRDAAHPGNATPRLDPGQLKALYDGLRGAQQARVSYVAAMNLYVEAVNADAPEQDRRARERAFGESARGMQTALTQLSAAFQPLQLGADLTWPALSDKVRRYEGEQQAGVLNFRYDDVIRTLSRRDLNRLRDKVLANEVELNAALDETTRALRATYGS